MLLITESQLVDSTVLKDLFRNTKCKMCRL